LLPNYFGFLHYARGKWTGCIGIMALETVIKSQMGLVCLSCSVNRHWWEIEKKQEGGEGGPY